MRSLVIEEVLEQSKALPQRHILLQRRDDRLAEPAFTAEFLCFSEELFSDGDRRAHMQNVPDADAPVNVKCIAPPGQKAMETSLKSSPSPSVPSVTLW